MAKKSFKSALNNPAMQFISVAEEVPPVQVEQPKKEIEKKQTAATPASQKSPKKTASKPAQTVAPKMAQEKAASKAPEGYKVNPMYVEVKSKRVQLVLQPSLFEKVKALAEKNGDSVNNTVHAILEQATAEE